MARLREFDTDVALDAAMQAFWLRGYEATSMADVMAATGLKNAVSTRHSTINNECISLTLQQYLDQTNAFNRQYLEDAKSPKAELSDLLHAIISQ